MRKNKIKFLLILLIGVSTIWGCQKYDEGPFISFIPARIRVAGNWNDNFGEKWDFKTNGDYTVSLGDTMSYSGNWDFDSKKEYIVFDGKSQAKIIELRERKMQLQIYGTNFYFSK